MIDVRLFTDADESLWNAFTGISKNAVFFQHRQYLSYHLHRFEERSLVFSKKGKVIALFPATVHEQQIISHGGITFAGLLTGKEIKTAEVMLIFDLLKRFYKSQGFEKIVYKASPSIFHQYPAQEDLYALFRHDAKLIRRDISTCISLPESIRFSETKRQLVRKCEAKQLQVVEQTDYSSFWQLLTSVVAQHGAMPTHSVEEISFLHQQFPSNIRLFEARLDDKLLAGTVLFDFGSVVHTQYMANSNEGRDMGALDFLIDHLINQQTSNKQYFNFGISTEQQGRYLNEGLVLQKELMGGRGITYDFYELLLT